MIWQSSDIYSQGFLVSCKLAYIESYPAAFTGEFTSRPFHFFHKSGIPILGFGNTGLPFMKDMECKSDTKHLML
jgi:hypothetical protein